MGRDSFVDGPNERPVVIKSVEPKEGGLDCAGNYDITGQRLERKTYDVSLEDGAYILTFVTGAKSPGRLKLVGDRKLEEWLNVVVDGGRNQNKILRLEKVQPKKEDSK